MNGRDNVLLDHRREGVPHELDGVIPVAFVHGQLLLDVPQRINMSLTAVPLHAELILGIVSFQPGNTVVQ